MYFDNLRVRHDRGRILEENHFYAYGLKIAALSSTAFGGVPNNYKYQGDYSEFDDDLGWNDFMLRSYDPQIGRFLQWDPYDEFASGYIGMGNDPVNLTDPTGGCVDCTLQGVVVTAARRTAQTGNQAAKVINTTATTLKVVQTTYQIYQNSIGETFETTNPGLGSNTSYNGQSWDRVGSRTENLHIPDDGLPSHLSGDRWHDRLKYFYKATHDLPDGASWDDAWDLAEYRWNYNRKFNVANLHYTRESFWSGEQELLYALPTAIQPTDGPEALIGAGALKGGMMLLGRRSVQQYALRATKSGFYPVMKRGFRRPQELQWLDVGDAWKFGTTKNPFKRYSKRWLRRNNLDRVKEFEGNASEARSLQNMKIDNYKSQNGHLPPGNKIRN